VKNYARVLLFAIPLTIASVVFAQPQTFTVNPDTSQVAFTLAGTGHHVQGTFRVQSGSIKFVSDDQKISGTVVVAAGSGNSGEPSRDKKMNSEVLQADHFAEVTFAPRSYQGTIAAAGDSNIQVSGIFTLLGTPHDITVPMQIHIDGANLKAKGHFTVPYVKWGLKDPSIFILKVAKEVDIDINLSGQLTRIALTWNGPMIHKSVTRAANGSRADLAVERKRIPGVFWRQIGWSACCLLTNRDLVIL
jgi:hypothetical protein